MKKLWVLMLLSFSCWAGPVTPGGSVPSLTVGGRTFTDLTNLVVVRCYAAASSTTNCTPRQQGVGAGYQIPSGKTYTIYAWKFLPNGNAAVGTPIYIFSSSNDVGVNSSSSFTGIVYWGASQLSSLYGTVNTSLASNSLDQLEGPVGGFQIGYPSYPAVQTNGTAGETELYGYTQ